MSTPPTFQSFAVSHTFGREHLTPPPLPSSMQRERGQLVDASLPSANASTPIASVQAEHLPNDFDHLVRSIGEW